MNFRLIFDSVKEVFTNHPSLFVVGAAGIIITFLIVIDTHKFKKERTRKRRNNDPK